MYQSFAEVYDMFMDDVPYDAWASRIIGILRENGIKEGALLCDLACGTGQMTRRFADAGYDVIGVDASVEMLDAARQKGTDGILYLLQDMRSFELYGTVLAITCICDSLNYLLKEEDLRTTFALVANYLEPGGIFVFDMKTPYTYEEILKDGTFAENDEDGSYIWENHYDKEERLNEYDLTLFIREEDGRFARYTETHRQRAYGKDEVERLLKEGGLIPLSVTDAQTGGELTGTSERMLVVARSAKTFTDPAPI